MIVVGGGPAGAAIGWALAQSGANVRILDRARFPRDKPCAEYLSPEASRILSDMGALAAVEGAGAAHLAGMTVRAPDGAMMRGDFAASHGYRGFRDRGLAIRRRTLDAILLGVARAAGAEVIEGVRVSDVHRDVGRGRGRGRVTGVRVRLPSGEESTVRARLVIGADGLRSVVARRLGLARTARWPRRIALVTHYRGVDGVGQHGEMHVERGGYTGIADVGNGETNVAVVIPARRAGELVAGRIGFLESWLAARPHLAPRFAGAERVSPVWTTGPFASRARLAWAPGAALVGDAADFYDPFTGEGIYAALHGGEILAPFALDAIAAMAAGDPRSADRALAAYNGKRREVFGRKWTVERLVATAVAFPVLINRVVRVLARRKDMADLLVGVTGDFVPPHEVLRPSYLMRLLT
ncbi:MAG: NAD(P)/FAD-dependent oxidoreductase [Gemmatimonadaceae bacterium]